jgi:hypothetical protein
MAAVDAAALEHFLADQNSNITEILNMDLDALPEVLAQVTDWGTEDHVLRGGYGQCDSAVCKCCTCRQIRAMDTVEAAVRAAQAAAAKVAAQPARPTYAAAAAAGLLPAITSWMERGRARDPAPEPRHASPSSGSPAGKRFITLTTPNASKSTQSQPSTDGAQPHRERFPRTAHVTGPPRPEERYSGNGPQLRQERIERAEPSAPPE